MPLDNRKTLPVPAMTACRPHGGTYLLQECRSAEGRRPDYYQQGWHQLVNDLFTFIA